MHMHIYYAIFICYSKLVEYQREHEDASTDMPAYVSNPINAYLLTKRLTTDWRQVENLMAHDVGVGKLICSNFKRLLCLNSSFMHISEFLNNITNYRHVLKFPSDEDLNGAAVALMRLQDTYKLDTSSVARGMLNGIQYR